MAKAGWAFTAIGLIAILGGLFYPFGVIEKTTFLILMGGGAFFMFTGTIIRALALLKK